MRRWSRNRGGALVAALASGAFFLAGCGAPQSPAQEALVADPPVDAEEGAAAGAADGELQRGIAFIKSERYEDAKTHLQQALQKKPDSAEAAYYLGVASEKTGDRAGAEKAYQQALKSDPTLAEAALNLGAIYLEDPARPDEAIAVMTPALAKATEPARLHQNLAYAYGLKKDYEKAGKQYEAALGKGESADLYFAYGMMLVEAKQGEKAAAQLNKALGLAGSDVALVASIGRALGPAGAYGDCVKAFDRAIQLKPDAAELHVRRGTCRHELKDEPGARADYQAAIKADPSFAPAHYYLGMSWLGDKKTQEARAAFEQASKVGGETEIGKRAREKLKDLGKKK
ncbi:tetratricopeptide repeat protein [Chondromyces apiculatus]|uniref:Adenylate cyclase n=1 Tax=Chondromyces apiculatus DSM 436 TaxID=1192034 RepID=A0A017SV57_9BACT|nr:tetratricopeptide repeat protein [Chondromyces apiculatus]EYF00878.1 Adenylate cyclase [Chondromyces apiculatus DSM 436]